MLLDDPGKLKEMLVKLGSIHSLKGVPWDSFAVLGNAFIATVKAGVGHDCSIETVDDFALFYNEGTNLMFEG